MKCCNLSDIFAMKFKDAMLHDLQGRNKTSKNEALILQESQALHSAKCPMNVELHIVTKQEKFAMEN